MNTQVVDPLDDIVIQIDDSAADPKALPKNPDGTPNISHKENKDAVQKAREEAERLAGEGFQRERQQMQDRIDRERRAREQAQREADALIENERQARLAAEHGRAESRDLAMRAHLHTLATQKEAFESHAATLEAHMESLQTQISKASEAGDHAAVGRLTMEMAKATSGKATYDQSLARVNADLRRAEAAYQNQDPAPDPKQPEKKETKQEREFDLSRDLDAWIDGCPPNTHGWLRENRDKLLDPNFFARVNHFARGAVMDAGGDQSVLASDGFLRSMQDKFTPKPKTQQTQENDDMGTEEDEPAPQQQPVKRQGTHAAPVSRGGSPGPGGNANGNAIRLTQDQFNIAPQLYHDYEEFDADVKQKFPQWSETAARYQYSQHLKRAQAGGKFK